MTLDKLMIKYESPDNETSLAKGIPIKLLSWVQGEFKHPSRRKVRYVFRGVSIPGSYRRPQSWCHKAMADTFAIYKRSKVWYSA
jgi:hypothetical protein